MGEVRYRMGREWRSSVWDRFSHTQENRISGVY
jgi:hypothetical protein